MNNSDLIHTLPFPPDKQEKLDELLQDLSTSQIYWLHGYLQGILSSKKDESPKDSEDNTKPEAPDFANISSEVTVLFGTETGNSRKIAGQLVEEAEKAGIKTILADMNNYQPNRLKNEKNLLVIVSTHGEGEPPLAAEDFYNFIHSKRAPKLEGIRYSVLALGDKSYVDFCQTGSDIDKRLHELGAERISPRVDCDVDFATGSQTWINDVLKDLNTLSKDRQKNIPRISVNGSSNPSGNNQPTRTNPVETEIVELINLNGKGSSKETYHIELLFDNDKIAYRPGDALGIWPVNDPSLANSIIKKTKLNPGTPVNFEENATTLEDVIVNRAEINSLTRDNLVKYNELVHSEKLKIILNDTVQLKKYLWGRDILDLLTEYPADLSADQLVSILRKLQPRLYSLASSTSMFPGEAHLTVGMINYHKNRRQRKGTCTSYIGERIGRDTRLKVFIDQNERFKLPADPEKDIIMIGPGTGVAPFRAFMQEREMQGKKGKNWLFFGDRNFTTDFLYQTEWQQWHKRGLLDRIDLAFSRDQKEKVYVQHKMQQHSHSLYKWIEEGANLYVCGDRQYMAPDVQMALTSIIEREGGLSQEKAAEYVKTLKKQNRYIEDVY